ncbi:MAG: hypothetical protein HY825_05930 [Acidobacteria bacterium]|nr:hypothetical protein [Acidobacteriota bacterium]
MTEDEIRLLGTILDEKLSGLESRVDEKLSGFDRRVDELRRHFDVVAESLTGQIQQVAKGVVLANERLERVEKRLDGFEQHTTAEFGEVKSMIRLSYAELERRLGSLESTVLDLAHRVETLERHSSQ